MRFLLLLFILSNSIYAAQLQGKMFFEKNMPLQLGGFVQSVIQIWPSLDISEDGFNSLEGKYLWESFYVYKVIESKRSENNEDVLIGKLILIPIKKVSLEHFNLLDIDGVNYPITFENLIFKEETVTVMNEFTYLTNSPFDIPSKYKKYIIFVMILLLLIAAYYLVSFYRKKINRNKVLQKKDLDYQYWKSKFINCETRSDLEDIFQNKNVWLNDVIVHSQDIELLLKEYRILYKDRINDVEMNELIDFTKSIGQRI